MPLNINLPTDRHDGDPGHSAGHNAVNATLNIVGAVVDGIDVRTGKLVRGVAEPRTVSYTPSIILDATQGPLFRVVATGDLSLADIVEAVHGQTVVLRVFASGANRRVTAFEKTETIPVSTWWTGRFIYDQFTNIWARDGGGSVESSASSVTDHGALTGLIDDDHPQYLTQARADGRYYTEAEVDAALGERALAGHTHGAGGIDFTPVPLTAVSGTITPNADSGYLFRHDANANVTLANPTGGSNGQTIEVQVWAVGASRTLTTWDGSARTIPQNTAWWGRLSRDTVKNQWILDSAAAGGGGGAGSSTFTDTVTAPQFVAGAVTVPYAASITLNATQGTTFRVTAIGNVTIADITGGLDNQVLTLEILASGADRTVSFGGGALSPTVISAGQRWTRDFRFHAADNEWRLLPTGSSGSSSGGSGGVPDDGSVTNVKVASNAAISLDKTADGTRLAMTAAERSKVAGLAALASTASASDLTGGVVAPARLGSGTASSTTVLHGDSVWRAVTGGGGTGGVPDDGSVTNVKVAANAAISLDKTADSATRVTMTPDERTKLASLASNTAVVVRDVPVAQAYAATVTLNATAGNLREIIATGNLTLNEPSSPANGQMIAVDVFASGAQRVVTFAGTLKRPSTIASTLTIPANQWGNIVLKYKSSYGWTVGMAFAA